MKQPISAWWDVLKLRIQEMLSSDLNSKQDLIGMTLSPNNLKLLKINTKNKPCEVEYFEVIKLASGLVVNNEIKNNAAIAHLLVNALERSDLKTKNIALTIPRSAAIVKNISVNNRLQKDEIESRVWLEANRLFPNLIGDIYLDFSVIGPSSEDSNQTEVQLVACRKEQIKPYIEIMRLAGLNASVVDLNYYALERSLALITKQLPDLKTIAMLSIGFRVIDLLVSHQGEIIYTHELSYDGHNLFQLATELNSAEKKVPELTDEKRDVILTNTLKLHLKHSMQFFYSSRPSIRIDRIILSGDCSTFIPGLIDFVRQEVGKEVDLANPFKEMKLASKVDKAQLDYYASALMLCCGAALSQTQTY